MKKFKSKILTLALAICLIIPCVFILTACGDKEPPHTHAYDKVIYVVESSKAYEVKTCNCEEFTKTEIEGAVILTPENAYVTLNQAESGIFVLSDGQYELTNSINEETEGIGFFDASKSRENIAIYGTENAKVEMFSIKTAVKIDNVIFKNVTFNGSDSGNSGIAIRGDIKNLSVENCLFNNASSIHNGGNTVENFTVKNCSFNQEGASGTYSPIYFTHIINGDVLIEGNEFTNCLYNAIQFNGSVNANIVIKNNTINGTVDRALRFGTVNGCVSIQNNSIKNVQEKNSQVLKASSVTATGSIVFENNTYDGNAWSPVNVTAPATDVIYTIDLN